MSPAPGTIASTLRDGGRPLLGLLLLALLVKLVTIASAWDADPLARYPLSDSAYYLERARGLQGQPDPLAAQPHHLPPLYPQVLAWVPGATRGDPAGVLGLQAVLGVALLAGVFVLARHRASRTAALVAVGVTLAYGPLTFFETKLLGDAPACALVVFALVTADRVAAVGGAWRAALLGALVALTALARPQFLLLVPLLALWLAFTREGSRRILAVPFLAAAALLIAPSALHNLEHGGGLSLVSDNGGVNLWLANERAAPVSGTFNTHRYEFGTIEQQATAARRVAEEAAGQTLAPGDVSAELSKLALSEILAEPGLFARRVGLRALALLESFETGVIGFPESERPFMPPLQVLRLPFGLLAGTALALWLASRGGRRDEHEDPARAGGIPWLPAAAVAGIVVLTALVFFHYSRFRLPLVPVLAVTIAVGFDRVRARGATEPSRRAVAGLAAVAVIALSYLPAPHHAPVLANGRTTIGEARLSLATPVDGLALESAAQDALAALEAKPGFVRAEMLAAQTLLLLGRPAEARPHVEVLVQHVPDLAKDLVRRLRRLRPRDAALQRELDALDERLR